MDTKSLCRCFRPRRPPQHIGQSPYTIHWNTDHCPSGLHQCSIVLTAFYNHSFLTRHIHCHQLNYKYINVFIYVVVIKKINSWFCILFKMKLQKDVRRYRSLYALSYKNVYGENYNIRLLLLLLLLLPQSRPDRKLLLWPVYTFSLGSYCGFLSRLAGATFVTRFTSASVQGLHRST